MPTVHIDNSEILGAIEDIHYTEVLKKISTVDIVTYIENEVIDEFVDPFSVFNKEDILSSIEEHVLKGDLTREERFKLFNALGDSL